MKYEFFSKREREFLENPLRFRDLYGSDYAVAVRHRIRTKIVKALGEIAELVTKFHSDPRFRSETALKYTRTYNGTLYRKGIYEAIHEGINLIVNDMAFFGDANLMEWEWSAQVGRNRRQEDGEGREQ